MCGGETGKLDFPSGGSGAGAWSRKGWKCEAEGCGAASWKWEGDKDFPWTAYYGGDEYGLAGREVGTETDCPDGCLFVPPGKEEPG
jgi:hypothetical protein